MSNGFLRQFRQFLTDNGTGTGNFSMVGNFSITNKDFYIQPPPDRVFYIGSVLIAVSDNSNFAQTDFGGIIGGLSAGCIAFIRQDNIEFNAFGTLAVKRNIDWMGVASEARLFEWAGVTNTLQIRFETLADSGGYVKLDGRTGDQLGLRIRDDTSTLVEFISSARGAFQIEPWEILKN